MYQVDTDTKFNTELTASFSINCNDTRPKESLLPASQCSLMFLKRLCLIECKTVGFQEASTLLEIQGICWEFGIF